MFSYLRTGLCALSFLPFPALATPPSTDPQYVILSFDGASFVEQWERSRSLGRKTGARFTYFLSCVYLLTRDTRDEYKAPGMKAGRSNVGFAASPEDVRARLGQIWTARAEGHEIASHGCGHFDGKAWSKKDWMAEFDQFTTILEGAWRINDLEGEPEGWNAFATGEIKGFRAPYLSTGPGLYDALAADGFDYDASTVSRGPARPAKDGWITRFALPLIPEGPSAKRLIAMDYNLYVRHSGGKEAPDQAGAFTDRAFEAFMAAFEREYGGERVPLQVGFHFTLMNDGAYWKALERFAEEVCVRDDVRCVSYREYLQEKRRETGAGVGG
ncbi:polysaccharide deacetylase [Nitratireductor luteus]|uniref:polysaccharide deacetylase n=1 Tax=Nitratireductor luteus TaxID=2976980 RepID=UPI00223F6247|nr:polysaccharide deacetylase [Nitratireductor luteus]